MNFNSKQRFSIRKFSVGTASVLLGSVILGTTLLAEEVKANEVSSNTQRTSELETTNKEDTQAYAYEASAVTRNAMPAVSASDATDPMPTEELTDLSQMARPNESDHAVSDETLAGNQVQVADLPSEFQNFKPADETKRVSMILAVSGRDGKTDERYYSLISNLESAAYEVQEYNRNKRLVNTVSLGSTDQKVFYPTGSRTADRPKLTVTTDNQGARLVFDRARNWKTNNKYAIRTLYSTVIAPVIPSNYGGEENHQTNFDQFSQQLPFASEVKVNYILRDTGEQIADSNVISVFANDTYKTVAAKESDFYKEFQDKGYTLVEEPTYKEGKINATYWGGKGFVAINDVTNTVAGITRELRIRRTVVNDQGDITIEAWDKASGVKLPIQRYTKSNGEVVNLSGFNTYVSEAIRPSDPSLVSNALYKEVAFAFKDEKGVMFYSNDSQTRYTDAQVRQNPKLSQGLRLSSWTSSWRPAAAEVNYVYAKTKANVEAHYINTDGTVIKAPQSVAKLSDIGTSYTAETPQLKPARIVAEDNKVYTLVATAGVTKNGISYGADGVATGQGHAAASGRVLAEDQVVTFVYQLDEQKAVVRYINQTDGKELSYDSLVGLAGERMNYSTAERIAGYEKDGYKLISDGFTSAVNKNFDSDSSVDQEFIVVLEERIEPVTPQDPTPVPFEPVRPNDPANWPKEVNDMEELTNTVVSIIYFRTLVGGKEVSRPVERTVEFEKTAYVNLVTGDIRYSTWRVGKTTDRELNQVPTTTTRAAGFRSVGAVNALPTAQPDAQMLAVATLPELKANPTAKPTKPVKATASTKQQAVKQTRQQAHSRARRSR